MANRDYSILDQRFMEVNLSIEAQIADATHLQLQQYENLQSCFNEERSELLVRTKELHELQNEAVVRHENFVKLQNDYNDLMRIKMEMQNQLETYKNLQLIDRREES